MKDLFDLEHISLVEKPDLRQQLIFLMNGARVNRFHTYSTIKPITVGAHSHGVAWLVYILTEGTCSANLLMAALSHDMAEQVTGDMPSPTKRNLGIRETFSDLEDTLLVRNLAAFEISDEEQNVLKMADLLEALLSCLHERMLGNRYMERPFRRMQGYIRNDCIMTDHQRSVLEAVEQLWTDENFCTWAVENASILGQNVRQDAIPLPPQRDTGRASATALPAASKVVENAAFADSKANVKAQVGGQHYREAAVQHWDFAALQQLDYFQGQITKYVVRWKKKNGLQDLEKALHFLEKYIEVHKHFAADVHPK